MSGGGGGQTVFCCKAGWAGVREDASRGWVGA